MKRFLAAALLICSVTDASAQPLWAGLWAADPAWCANASRIGEVPTAPIDISETKVRGYENSCDVIGYKPVPPGQSWLVSKSCTGEGETYQTQELFLLSADGRALTLWDGFFAITFSKCD